MKIHGKVAKKIVLFFFSFAGFFCVKVMLTIARHAAAGLNFYGLCSPKHETSITIIMFADGLVINFFDCIILSLEMLGCEELLKSCSSAA